MSSVDVAGLTGWKVSSKQFVVASFVAHPARGRTAERFLIQPTGCRIRKKQRGDLMPMHDWKRVDAGIYHALHHSWIEEIHRALLKR